MTKTVIWGTTLALVFALSMITAAFAGGHLNILSSSVQNNPNSSMFKLKVAADIESAPGAFGYGAIGETGVIAVTTHGGVGPDSEAQADQNDDVLHTHIVTLRTTPECKSENDAGLAVATASFEEVGKLTIKGDKLKVSGIPNSAVGDLNGAVVAFTLSVVGNPGHPHAICVNLVG